MLAEQTTGDPHAAHTPVYKTTKAAKSRVHSFGPTIADKTVQFMVIDDNNNRYRVRSLINGERSVFDACAEHGVPGFRRSQECRPAGEKGEAGCGHCHLVLSQRLYDQTPAPILAEWYALGVLGNAGFRAPTSRLSCQLPLEEVYDGATLLLPTRPTWWEDHITSRQPSNRIRGNRGNLYTLGHVRDLRITPTRELFVGNDERPANRPEDPDEPTFADRFWSVTHRYNPQSPHSPLCLYFVTQFSFTEFSLSHHNRAASAQEYEGTKRAGKLFPSLRVPKHWNTAGYTLVGSNRDNAGIVYRILG